MPNLTSITLSASGNVTSSGQFSTLDNSFGTAGTSNVNVLTVQGVTSAVNVGVTGTVAVSGTSNVALTGTGTVNVVAATTISTTVSSISGVNVTSSSLNVNILGLTSSVAISGANVTNSSLNVNIQGTSSQIGITGSVTVSQATASSLQVTINSAQLQSLLTSGTTEAAGYQLVGLPTDQAVPIKVQSITSGASMSRITMTASGNLATNVKNAAGNIYEIDVYNTGTAPYYVKFINTTTTPTAGTGSILLTVPVGPTSGYSKEFRYGMNFSTGIGFYITGALADTDTSTVPSVLTGNIIYV